MFLINNCQLSKAPNFNLRPSKLEKINQPSTTSSRPSSKRSGALLALERLRELASRLLSRKGA